MTDDRDPNSGELNADLSDEQLAAANLDAKEELVDQEADDLAYDPEADEAELEGEDEDDLAPAPARRPGARAAANASRERAHGTGSRTPRPPKAARTTLPIDPALRIKDPASAWLVVGAVVLFALIFLRSMAFGHGGAFTAVPTPTPIVNPSAAPSTSPSGSAAPSGSPAASPAASQAASPAAT